MSDATPAVPTWIRSSRLGSPRALKDILDVLRQGRDYLEVVDPLAQGLATVAEIEARLIEIFQALSIQRGLSLVVTDALLALIRPYLTDGVYFIQHSNLRELFERVGTSQFIEGMEAYVDDVDLEGAERPDTAQYVRFGPERNLNGGEPTTLHDFYKSYPQVIEGVLDARKRAAVRSALGAFEDVEFNSFDDWLSPILAAFTDPGDPNKPVVFPRDKMGGFILAVQGADPVEVYDKFVALKSIFEEISTRHLDFTDVFANYEEELGLDTIQKWDLMESLDGDGFQLRLRPSLSPRYSTQPDFQRVSTADILPFLSPLLIEAQNLMTFTGLPFPENFNMVAMAQRLAQKFRKYLEAYDAVIDALTAMQDVLELADVWRLHIPSQEGGIEEFVETIREAPRDDVLRVIWGTQIVGTNDDGSPSLQEFEFGRIISLPDDTSGIPEYTDQAVGDFFSNEDLRILEDAFTAAGRVGYSYSTPRVYRRGETIRKSRAEALKRAFPGFAVDSPGDLMIMGLGVFYVDGAIARLFESIFAPEEKDYAEWLCDGPPAESEQEDFSEGFGEGYSFPSGMVEPEAPNTQVDPVEGVSDATSQGEDFTDSASLQPAPQNRGSERVDCYGLTRSYESTQRACVPVPSDNPHHTWLRGERLASVSGASAPCESLTTWLNSPGRLEEHARLQNVPQSISPVQTASTPAALIPCDSLRIVEDGAADVDPAHVYAPTSITDAVIQAGGVTLQSGQLATFLNTAGFVPGLGGVDVQWCLDVTLLFAQTPTERSVRTTIQGFDLGTGRIDIYPALPSTPETTSSSPVRAFVFSQNEPCVRVDVSDRDAEREDPPGWTVDIVTSLRKQSFPRTTPMEEYSVCALQGVQSGHITALHAVPWGSMQPLTFTQLEGREGQINPTVKEESIHDATRLTDWPIGDLTFQSDLLDGAVEEASPIETSLLWRESIEANTTLVVHTENKEVGTLRAPYAAADMKDLWTALHIQLSAQARIAMGGVTAAPVEVYVRPSLWTKVLFVSGGEYTLGTLSDVIQPANASHTRTIGGRKVWRLFWSAQAQIDYAGYSAYLLYTSSTSPDPDDVLYGSSNPWFQFSPFVRQNTSVAYEEGDVVSISRGPWVREGLTNPLQGAFGGTDGVHTATQWMQPLAGTSRTSLRPSDGLQAGAVILDLVWGADTFVWEGANTSLIQGSTHRVVLTEEAHQLTWVLEERDASAQEWFVRGSCTSRHFAKEERVVLVVQSIPGLSRLDIQVSSRTSLGSWELEGYEMLSNQDESAYPEVYPLEGLPYAGGTWIIARSTWQHRSALSSEVPKLWSHDVSDQRPSGIPFAWKDVQYVRVSQNEPENVLLMYR